MYMYIPTKRTIFKKYSLELITFLFVFIILSFVQIKVHRPMLLLERFITGSGWIEIVLLSLYGSFVIHKMKNPTLVPQWRLRIWILFTIVFFLQLIIGLLGIPECLMTGKLHFPIPALILVGPIYRGEISIMIILFLSTILLSGPAWCSQLCYFGALDGLASKGKTPYKSITYKWRYKIFGIITIIGITILLRLFQVNTEIAIILASILGIGGVVIIVFISRRKNKMIHCITYCPIGTIVSFAKFASPFRMKINEDCSQCMKCTSSCKYDALNIQDIKNLKPGLTCTYCGDCIQTCHSSSIEYKFFSLSSQTSRNVYLIITISLHVICLGMARI